MKRGTPDHPKLLMLAGILNLRKFQAAGILELLWHWTAKYSIQGNIGKWSNAAIAQAIDWDREPDELIAALVKSGWLDNAPEPFRLVIHDIADHADNAWKQGLSDAGLTFWDGTPPRRAKRGRPSNSRDIPEEFQKNSSEKPEPSLPFPSLSKSSARKQFVKPTLEQISAYCQERGNLVDPQTFLDHYESNGWKVGKVAMRDWKAAVRTWERNGFIRADKPDDDEPPINFR